jgi:hypothetical protein
MAYIEDYIVGIKKDLENVTPNEGHSIVKHSILTQAERLADIAQHNYKFHKLSDRHILVVETNMSSSDIQKVVVLSDKIRKAGNELVSLMRKNYDQLIRTKKYRKLLKLYGSTTDKKKRKDLANQLNEIQKQYNITWDYCRSAMIPIGKKYGIDAVFALTKAEDI